VDFKAYVTAIEAAAPGVPIEGDDAAGAPNDSFQQAFIKPRRRRSGPPRSTS
jgi:hypothetical protein